MEKERDWNRPMTPLATLLTAQLFQISWARISSMVGIRIGWIWVTLSSEPTEPDEEPPVGSALLESAIFKGTESRIRQEKMS